MRNIFLALALLVCACTKAQQAVIVDVSGAVCEIVVQATNPALRPICTTLEEVETVFLGLLMAHGVDIEAAGPPSYVPSQDDIYNAIAGRRAAGITH